MHKIKKGFQKVGLDIKENEGVSKSTRRRQNSHISRERQGGPMRDKFLPNRKATTWNLLLSEIAGRRLEEGLYNRT